MSVLLAISDEVFSALNCDSWHLLVFYLLCGVSGGLFARLLHRGYPVNLVGASGAVSGVMMCLVILRPHSAIEVFGEGAGTPLLWVFGKLSTDLLLNVATGQHISWQAHAGGFAAGAVLSHLRLVAL